MSDLLRIGFALSICLLFAQPSLQRTLDSSCDEECQCRPPIESNLIQNVIGYGSLIKASSVKRTNPFAGESIPVSVKGYRRSISAQGASISYSTTFMGVEESEDSSFNGVAIPLGNNNTESTQSELIKSIDLRERWYCRVKVPIERIQFLDGKIPQNNEYWIYISKPEFSAKPSQKYPIVQSYIDIFLAGCLEIEEKFNLAGYARDCVTSTHGWSEYWINDRIFPRRASYYEPKAHKIDKLLISELPQLFKNIKVEGSFQ